MSQDLRLVLSRSQWNRLQEAACQHGSSKALTRDEMVNLNVQKNFSRSMRKRREQHKKMKEEEKAERERQERESDRIVEEETARREEEARQRVDRDRNALFQQKGVVKDFNRALAIIEIQKHNQALIEKEKQKKEKQKEIERQFLEERRCRLAEAQKKEDEKAAESRRKTEVLKAYHQNQVELRKIKKEQEQQEREREESPNYLNHQSQVEDELRKKLRASRQRSLQNELLETVEKNKQEKAREAQKESEEAEKRECVERAREVLQRQREKVRACKIRRREAQIDRVSQRLADIKNDQAALRAQEEEKVLNAAREKQQREEKEALGKVEKNATMWRSLLDHREAKLRSNEEERRNELKSILEHREASESSERLFLQSENARARIVRENNIRLQEINCKVAEENRARVKILNMKEREEEQKRAALSEQMDGRFHHYVESELNRAAARGTLPQLLQGRIRKGIAVDDENLYLSSTGNNPMPRLGGNKDRAVKAQRTIYPLDVVDYPPSSRASDESPADTSSPTTTRRVW